VENLIEFLIKRDGISRNEALWQISMAKEKVLQGDDPVEVLENWFGLGPDYLYALIG
jgi:hypothetical protein